METTVITYGTYDLFHIGHLRMFTRLRELGDRLVVGVSTDEFNLVKGKTPIIPFEQRIEIVRALKVVDEAFAEERWDQKRHDFATYGADIFGMGDDWEGQFDHLSDAVKVVYLPRTTGISTSETKRVLSTFDARHVDELKSMIDRIGQIVTELS